MLLQTSENSGHYAFKIGSLISDQIEISAINQNYKLLISGRFSDIEEDWRAFQKAATCSVYQHVDFLKAWHQSIGENSSYVPVLCSLYDQDDKLILIWPLVKFKQLGVSVVSWMAGKHANYNVGLFESDSIHLFNKDLLQKILDAIASSVDADVCYLTNQPVYWGELKNPMAELHPEKTADLAYSTTLGDENFEKFMERMRGKKSRKRLKWQRRKLEQEGQLETVRPETKEEAEQFLYAFLEQKRSWFERNKIDNPFFDSLVQSFLAKLTVTNSIYNYPELELFALKLNGDILSVYGGSRTSERFSTMFSSFDSSHYTARYSPAEILLQDLIKDLMDAGIKHFDLGYGTFSYKLHWCDNKEQLYSCIYGFTPRGKLFAKALKLKDRLKGILKRQKHVSMFVRRLYHLVPFRKS